jgi:hypothetical protein
MGPWLHVTCGGPHVISLIGSDFRKCRCDRKCGCPGICVGMLLCLREVRYHPTPVYIMRSARAAMTVAGNACAKNDAKSDMI